MARAATNGGSEVTIPGTRIRCFVIVAKTCMKPCKTIMYAGEGGPYCGFALTQLKALAW